MPQERLVNSFFDVFLTVDVAITSPGEETQKLLKGASSLDGEDSASPGLAATFDLMVEVPARETADLSDGQTVMAAAAFTIQLWRRLGRARAQQARPGPAGSGHPVGPSWGPAWTKRLKATPGGLQKHPTTKGSEPLGNSPQRF